MKDEQRRKLRHDILGCLNSIKLSMEVIRGAKDQDEAIVFLDCIGNEVTKVERFVDDLMYESQDTAPVLPPTYRFIPLSDVG